MGLSKRNRVRNTDVQTEPAQLIFPVRRAIPLGVILAVRRGAWLQDMQKELQKTAASLRDNPASALARFQKTLSRPSYFYKSPDSGQWTLLLGPESKTQATAPMAAAATRRVFDFVVKPPVWTTRIARLLRSLHQWLMHPLIDTREPPEPA